MRSVLSSTALAVAVTALAGLVVLFFMIAGLTFGSDPIADWLGFGMADVLVPLLIVGSLVVGSGWFARLSWRRLQAAQQAWRYGSD